VGECFDGYERRGWEGTLAEILTAIGVNTVRKGGDNSKVLGSLYSSFSANKRGLSCGGQSSKTIKITKYAADRKRAGQVFLHFLEKAARPLCVVWL